MRNASMITVYRFVTLHLPHDIQPQAGRESSGVEWHWTGILQRLSRSIIGTSFAREDVAGVDYTN
jgi:hypothetical protein